MVLSLVHLFLFIPALFAVAFFRSDMPPWAFIACLTAGLGIGAYHAYRLYGRLMSGSSYAWVNAFHLLILAPLLVWIGVHGRETARSVYEALLMVAFAGLGYHLYSIVREVNM